MKNFPIKVDGVWTTSGKLFAKEGRKKKKRKPKGFLKKAKERPKKRCTRKCNGSRYTMYRKK